MIESAPAIEALEPKGMLAWLRSLADAILGKVPGEPDRLDTATRMALDADFGDRGEHPTHDREPPPDVDPLEKLMRIAANPTHPSTPARADVIVRVSTDQEQRRRGPSDRQDTARRRGRVSCHPLAPLSTTRIRRAWISRCAKLAAAGGKAAQNQSRVNGRGA